MSKAYRRGVALRPARPTLLRRSLLLLWKVIRALLVAGAAIGPAPPPPPPPPPQTVELRAEDGTTEDER
jgi:hypothetical protein